MKNSLVLLAIGLLVGTLGGTALGYFLKPSEHAIPEQGGDPVPLGTLPAEEPVDADPEPLDSEATKLRPARTLQDFIDEAQIPEIPTGDSAFTGTVVSADGEPLAGIEITASSSYPESRRYTGLSPEERIRQEIRYSKWSEVSKRKGVSHEDGTWQINGVSKDVVYYVSADAPGWSIERKQKHMSRVKPPAQIEFVANPRVNLEVVLRLPDGSTPESGEVRYRSNVERERTSYYRREYSASLNLTPGRWSIDATAGELSEYCSDTITLEVEAGKGVEPLTIQLRPAPGIQGLITLPSGFSTPEFTVYAQLGPDTGPPGDDLPDHRGLLRGGVTYEGGSIRYRVSGVEDGLYRIFLSDSGRILDWGNVVVSDGVAELDLRLPEPTPEDYIVVKVFDPEGKLLQGVDFGLTARYENGSSSSSTRPVVKDDGSYWIRRTAGVSERPVEWYEVRISASGYGQKSVRYEATDTHVLEVHLAVPAVLNLTVPNLQDHPAKARLSWRLTTFEGDSERPHVGRSDPRSRIPDEGPITLGPVEPGEYDLVVSLSGYGYQALELKRRRITMVSGENELTESVPELYRLVVNVETDSKRPDFSIESSEGNLSIRSHDLQVVDGKVTVEFLPAGTYRLVARDGEMEVSVPSQSNVDYKPRPFDCFVLTLRPSDGRIAALGFKDGDKLIEIDGAELENGSAGSMQLQATFVQDSTTWVVLRNGVRTQLTFSGKELYAIMTDPEDGKREWLQMERGMSD
ncbi:MAG: hypothetical protein KDB68_10335 [Planctomycetes bacterium]|nr:hypothetical protein [Planctomycetota bacterium]MCA8936593.1 hypothetical protein [Planctomycetota bacterium]